MPRGPRLIAGEGAINSRVRGAASSQKVKKVKASTESIPVDDKSVLFFPTPISARFDEIEISGPRGPFAHNQK